MAQRAINSVDFEDTDATRELQLTAEPEQFVGFELERITRTAAVVLDNATEEGVAGFTLKVRACVCVLAAEGRVRAGLLHVYCGLGAQHAVLLGNVLNADCSCTGAALSWSSHLTAPPSALTSSFFVE